MKLKIHIVLLFLSISIILFKQKSLQSGTCVAFGRMMRIPMIVKMQMPNPEPQSANASIYDKWMVEWKN